MMAMLMEVWAWLVPVFALGAISGWLARMTYDSKVARELQNAVEQEDLRIHELEELVHSDEKRIRDLASELQAYRSLYAQANPAAAAQAVPQQAVR